MMSSESTTAAAESSDHGTSLIHSLITYSLTITHSLTYSLGSWFAKSLGFVDSTSAYAGYEVNEAEHQSYLNETD